MNQKRILSLALAAAMALSLTACGSKSDSSSSADDTPTGVAVQVQPVTADTISTENKVSGKVVSDNESSVFVASSAKCTAVYVDAGDMVSAGQKLCTLDLASTISSYNAANISYNSAVQSYQDQKNVFDSQIALYTKNVNDLKALKEIGAASQIEIDQAQLQLESAVATKNSTLSQLEAGMQSYKSNVEQLSTVLENVDGAGNVIAPISGTLVTLNAEENAFVSPSMPMAVVMTTYVGANPSDIEELVTSPLESAIMSVSGVDEITSTSAENVSTIQITYLEGTDLDIAATKLREQFDRVSLPDDASDPIIVNINISELMPTAMIALVGDDLSQLQAKAEDDIAPALERIDGVAQVTVSGGTEQHIAVRIDQAKAAGFGLSNSYISQFLAGQNLLYPGGDLQNGTQKLTVSTDAKFQSVDDVANTIIALPSGGTVRLSEVASVALEDEDSTAIAKVGDTGCVMLQVSKQSGANEMAAAQAVEKRLEELKADDPTLQYTIPYSAREYISQSVNAAFSNIIQGVVLAAIVVFLFLRRGGPTFTICVSMPVCILSVFVLMNVFDLTLNMMSLGGIAMGVGMIVDNSIVVLENINRFALEGHDRMSACVDGTKEVTSSVIASTLTTLAVFVPLGLSGGIAGQMFRDFCLTIASLIGASLLISLTLVPLLCYFTLTDEKVEKLRAKEAARQAAGAKKNPLSGFLSKLNAVYLRLLNFFIRHLKIGMLVSVGLVVFFAATLASTKMVMIPDMDQGSVSVSISLPTGSSLEESTAIADRVTAIVQREVPELDEMYYLASNGSSMMSAGNSVTMGLKLVDKSDRDRSAFDIVDDLRSALQDIAGCEITVSASSMSMGTTSGDDISVEIQGDDYDTLEMISNDLAQQISALPDAINVESSLADKVAQVRVTMKREAASQYGLTAATVGAAVRAHRCHRHQGDHQQQGV